MLSMLKLFSPGRVQTYVAVSRSQASLMCWNGSLSAGQFGGECLRASTNTGLYTWLVLQGHTPEMVVDGPTLKRILGTASEPLLAELANMCSGVVVCRASPSQKATIVRMMKRFQSAQLAGTVSPDLCVAQHLAPYPDRGPF